MTGVHLDDEECPSSAAAVFVMTASTNATLRRPSPMVAKARAPSRGAFLGAAKNAAKER
jgi:hypothetical protein